ncbi:MAG: carboxypeptidase-like regulatory domain-containing protein [Mangrovibacterium sp.]
MRFIYVLFLVFMFPLAASAQSVFSATVKDVETKQAIAYAYITTPDKTLWTMSDENGHFHFNALPKGKNDLEISCLGYAKMHIAIIGDKTTTNDTVFWLQRDNLALSEVLILAEKNDKNIETSFTIDRNAINQTQAVDLSSLLSLMPGEQSSLSQNMSSAKRIAIRSESSSELDNATFGTAIEVDGVRLSNNSAFAVSSMKGVEGIDTRNIGVSNIESVEIVTGLASVEHGDLNTGMVKINTKKGKSPLSIELVTKPMIKSIALNKGFELPNNKGQLNLSAERTASISDRSSPYNTYHRNNIGATYRRSFDNTTSSLVLTSGLSGNFGGKNTESDPDAFTDTYSKYRDASFRAYANLDWAVNKKWLTNLYFSASANYADKTSEIKTNKSSAAATASIHTTEEGYLLMSNYDDDTSAPIYAIPAGYWYQTQLVEEKPFSANLKVKADWAHTLNRLRNNFTLGAEWNYADNFGVGEYYADERYAPTYRTFNFSEQPAVNTWAAFAEDKLSFPIAQRELEIRTGVRMDMNTISGSIYGNASAFSPRVNMLYKFLDNKSATVKKLRLCASFGDAVKLPSSAVLFPSPTYRSIQTFASPTYSDGTVYYGYYTSIRTPIYNQNLKWQRSRKGEIGMDMTIRKTKIALTTYVSKTFNPYKYETNYTPLSYKLTSQRALNNVEIPLNERYYTVDESGVVSVHDQTGSSGSEELAYTMRNTYQGRTCYSNSSPVWRKGLEWLVDFGKVESLKTSIRLDGKYYHYKGVDETIEADLPSSGNMANGEPYKYIAYYVGGNGYYNGTESQKLSNNFTITTHIPEVRLVVSLRVEATFLNASQRLSEYSKGQRSYVLDAQSDYFPSETSTASIYSGDVPMAVYPLYYTSLDDPNTQTPFMETFRWAAENDTELYNELAKMVKKPTYTYWMNKQSYSPYYSANISVTKEIGDKISLSFNATNFTNRTATVKAAQTDTEVSLFSSLIPAYYYGLSLRVKL